MSQALLKQIYKRRPSNSKKGDFGRLLIVGGSGKYSGAPALASIAAYRVGCDVVQTAVPEKIVKTVRSFSPGIIAFPLKGNILERKHVKDILKIQERNSAMVIGPGLGRDKKTLSAVKQLLNKTKIPIVVDADALYGLGKIKLNKNIIITPHSGEFFMLTGMKIGDSLVERKDKTKALAKKLGCIVLLKGHFDVISDGRRIFANKTGNPYMTKGGTGDILSGVCGALLARGLDTIISARAGAYITGKAGDLASKNKKESLEPMDVLDKIIEVVG